jgi:hypothetical protein
MGRLLTMLCLLLAALVLPVTNAGPAVAKGVTSVTVSGPGIDDLRLGFTRRTDDVDVGTLSEATAVHGIFGDGQFVDRPDLTTAELGPRYVLTWYQAEGVMVESHVYPFAAGGAWAEVPSGQRLWGEPLATGWWHGGTALQQQLVTLGAPEPAEAGDVPEGPTGAVGAVTPSAPAPQPRVTLVAGSAAVVVLAVLGGSVWWLRRRRGPRPA